MQAPRLHCVLRNRGKPESEKEPGTWTAGLHPISLPLLFRGCNANTQSSCFDGRASFAHQVQSSVALGLELRLGQLGPFGLSPIRSMCCSASQHLQGQCRVKEKAALSIGGLLTPKHVNCSISLI